MGEWKLNGCAASTDGECVHPLCPQVTDGEPAASGRHCPLDARGETCSECGMALGAKHQCPKAPAIVAAGGWCAPSRTIYALGEARTHMEDLWRGQVEPTPEEIDAAIVEQSQVYEDAMRAWTATQRFLTAVGNYRWAGLAKEILELHSNVHGSCALCTGFDGESVEWPCSTVRVVVRSVGLVVPSEIEHDRPVKPTPDPTNPRWPFPPGPVPWFDMPSVRVSRAGISYGTHRPS